MPIRVKITPRVPAELLGSSNIAYGGIQPDVKVFVLFARDLEAKVGAITAHIPVAQPFVQPVFDKALYLRLQASWSTHPVAQKCFIGTKREEIVDGLTEHRRTATNGAVWILQIGRIIGGAAHLTHI